MTRRILGLSAGRVFGLLAMMTAGCGGQSVNSSPISPTAATPVAPVPTGPTVTLTGTVTDESGAGLSARVGASPLRWTVIWTGPPRSAEADAAGQYRLAALPEHPDTVYVRAWKDGYVQQCATAVTLQSDTSVNLSVTTYANARVTGLPASPGLRHISGVVYQGTGVPRDDLLRACGSGGNRSWIPWSLTRGLTRRDAIACADCRPRASSASSQSGRVRTNLPT